MKKYAIFDLDGTILDSMLIWKDFGERFIKKYGREPKEDLDEVLKRMSIGRASQYLYENYLSDMSFEEVERAMKCMIDDMYRNDVKLKPYARETLISLKKAGVIMCVATATDKPAAEQALRRLDILKYFEFVMACSDVGKGKEHPDIFLKAAERMGARVEDVAVFEDAYYSMKTAKEAGFYVIAVYDDMAKDEESKIREICDIYLETLKTFEDQCCEI